MELFRGKSRAVVGVDIGSKNIKVAQIEAIGKSLQLQALAELPTPADSVKGGSITNRAGIAESLRKLLNAYNITTKQAVLGITAPSIVIRYIDMPPLKKDEQLRAALSFEARKHIPFSVEDAIIECQAVGKSARGGQAAEEVLFVAAPRGMVDSARETLELADLEPLAIEPQAFADMRAVVNANKDKSVSQRNIGILNFGAAFSEFTIIKCGKFFLSRLIPLAGENITKAIASALLISDKDAEELKQSQGRATKLRGGSAASSGDDIALAEAISSTLEELIRELKRSINYYESQFPEGSAEARLHQLFLVGGACRLSGLKDYFEESLGIPTKIYDFIDEAAVLVAGSLQQQLQEPMPAYTTALGLALREPLLAMQMR